jgi:hypothetical protein
LLYQNLINGKLSHNLSWGEAVELVEHLGEVQPHGGDEFVFRVGGQHAMNDSKRDANSKVVGLTFGAARTATA